MSEEGNGKTEEQEQPPAQQGQQQMQITPAQIQAAAGAGAELLADKDLRIPLGAAGALSILQGLLAAVVRGDLAIVGAEQAAAAQAAPPNKRPNRSKKPRGART